LATADLPTGRKVVLGDIGLHSLTRDEMIKRNLADSAVMLSPGQIIGRIVEEPILKDQPFLTTGLYLEGDQPNLSDLLSPGFRAVSLQIPELRGGLTAPGSLVDVVFRSEVNQVQQGSAPVPQTTMTLFESVQVIAVAKPPPPPPAPRNLTFGPRYRPNPNPTITLAVTLHQANILQTVEGRGELTLIPRAAQEIVGGDEVARAEPAPATQPAAPITQPPRMTLEDLLGVQPEPPPFQTEIYRRGSRAVNVFDEASQLIESAAAPEPGADATSN
jgi:Flp pilus assembly protein CpaB